MNDANLVEELRKRVAIKSGIAIFSASDCKIISKLIFAETKNYLSESTIRNFFEIDGRLHWASPFVLNSLAGYVGLENTEHVLTGKTLFKGSEKFLNEL